MKIVEQLTLDFSAADPGVDSVNRDRSNVFSLDLARRAQLNMGLQNAYREILDSVKHVKLRRNGVHGHAKTSSLR